MKLHLPTSLRAALLACFSLVAPLAQTVSTGAFVGGVVTCSLLAPQAQAADEDISVADSYSESLSVTGTTDSNKDNREAGEPLYIYDAYTADDGTTVYGTYLGNATTATDNLTLTSNGTFFTMADAGTYDLRDVDITVASGLSSGVNLYATDTGSSSYNFGSLNVQSRIYLCFTYSADETGYMSFETLTGSNFVDVTLDHGSYSIDNENTGDYIVEFEHIEDFTSTIGTRTGASWGGKFGGGAQVYINKVTVTESGKTTTITGPYIYSENLTFYGAGKLSISVLNYEGDTLGMMHEGTMSIASLVLSQDLTLDYSGSETTVAKISAFTANDYTITLDLTGVDIASGFNLGISSSLSLDDFSFAGLSGTIGDDIFAYADAANGCWAITTHVGVDYTSDATGTLSISALVVTDADGAEQDFIAVDSITFTGDALTLTLDESFSADVITLGTEDAGIDMTLAGSNTLAAQELVLTDGTSLDMAGVTVSAGKITANGETTLSMNSRTFASTTSWSGEGEMTMNLTSGNVYIDGAMDYAGTITVDGQGENRYLYIRTPDLSLVNVDTFVMTNGADFVIGGYAGKTDESTTGADETLLDITVVLSDYDSRLMTATNYYYTQKVSNLVIVDGGVLKNGTYAGYNISGSYYYTYLNVGTITSSEDGSADAILSVETESGYTNVVVDLIEDLNATVTTSLIKEGKLSIGNITVGEGITTTIDCKVTADKSGFVAYSGSTLSMLNAGQLYIGCTSDGTSTGYLTLSSDLTLTYAGDAAELNLADVRLTGSKSVYLNIADLVLADDLTEFDLGLVYSGNVSLSSNLDSWLLAKDKDSNAWSLYTSSGVVLYSDATEAVNVSTMEVKDAEGTIQSFGMGDSIVFSGSTVALTLDEGLYAGTITLGTEEADTAMTLAGSSTLSAQKLVITDGSSLNMAGVALSVNEIVAKGKTSISMNSRSFTEATSWSGEGELTMNLTSGHVYVDGTMNYAGTITVDGDDQNRYLYIRTDDLSTVNVEKIVMTGNADFVMSGDAGKPVTSEPGAESLLDTTVVLTTFDNRLMSSYNTYSYQKISALEIIGGGVLKNGQASTIDAAGDSALSTLAVGTVSTIGEASEDVKLSVETEQSNGGNITIDLVKDFNATLTTGALNNGKLSIGGISVGADVTTVIDCAIGSDYTGTVAYTGETLSMLNAGQLYIGSTSEGEATGSLALANDLTLTYAGDAATLNVANVYLTGESTVSLDLTGLVLADELTEFDLGLVYDGKVSIAMGLVDWELSQDEATSAWSLSYVEPIGANLFCSSTGTVSASSMELVDIEGGSQSFDEGESITFSGSSVTLSLDEALILDTFTVGLDDSKTSMTLSGSSALTADEIVITDGSSLSMASVTLSANEIIANGTTAITTNSRVFAESTTWLGTGDMTVNLSYGHVDICGAMDFDGTITINGQGVKRYFRINTAYLSTVNVDKIIMTNASDFVFTGAAGTPTSTEATLLDTTIVLTAITNRFMTSGNTYDYQKVSAVEIIGGGIVKNGQAEIYDSEGNQLDTTSTLAIGTLSSSEDATEGAIVSFETDGVRGGHMSVDLIEDFNGTVTTAYGSIYGTSSSQGLNEGTFYIGGVSVGAGMTTVIDCAIADGYTGTVVYTGETLSMLNEGQLYIGCTSDGTNTGYMTLEDDLTLTYAGDTATLKLADVYLTGTGTVYLDLTDLVISEDTTLFDLGLEYDGEVVITNGLDGWYLNSAYDSWRLSTKESIEIPGTVEIDIPDTVVNITLYADYEYTEESGEFVTGNFAGVDGAASQIDVIDSNKAMVYFSGDVDTVISMQSTSDSEVNNALLVGSADGTTSNVTFDGLILSGENNNILWRDTTMTQVSWTFEEVTGEGSVDLAVATGLTAEDFANFQLIFNNVNDVNGTISNNVNREDWHSQAGGQIHISNVTASEGVATVISGDIYTTGLSFSGAGSLSLEGTLNYSGAGLDMLNEGALAIDTIVLSQDLTLDYTGTGTAATIEGLTANDFSLILNLEGVELGDSFELGLSSGIDAGSINLGSLTHYDLVANDEGMWTLNYDYLADSYVESLSLAGSTADGSPTAIDIFAGYTADDGSTVVGNYVGSNSTATSELILTTIDGFYQLNGAGTYDLTDVDITINNGTNSAKAVNFCADATGSSSYSFGTLDVAGGRVYLYFKCSNEAVETGYMSFETLTGQGYVDASLNHGTYSLDNENQGDFIVEFEHIEDYIGTIASRTGKSWGGKFSGGTQLYINKVTVTESGKTTTLKGPYNYTNGLTFEGAGKLNITETLNYLGDTLSMVNEGTLAISTLSLGADLTFDYTDAYTTTATITSLTSNGYDLSLDLTGVEIGADGYNLGLGSGVSLADATILGVDEETDVKLYINGSTWYAYSIADASDLFCSATDTISASTMVLVDADGASQSLDMGDSITFTGSSVTLSLDQELKLDVLTVGSEEGNTFLTLSGSSRLSADEIVITDGSTLNISSATISVSDIVANGTTAFQIGGRTLSESINLSGSGDLTISIWGSTTYLGSMDYDGTITIQDSSGEKNYVFYLNTEDLSTVNVDEIVLARTVDLYITGSAGSIDSLLDTTVVLSTTGNRIHTTGSTADEAIKISTVEIIESGIIKNGDSAGTLLAIGTLTTNEAAPTDGTAFASMEVHQYGDLSVDLIKDFHGTVATNYTGTTGITYGTLYIGDISVGEGITTIVDCAVASTGTIMYTGETLSMLNAGQLYVGCTSEGAKTGYMTLQDDLTLTYAGDAATLNVANVYLTGESTVSLDLTGLVLADDLTEFDLGLVYDGDVSIAMGLVDWELSQDEATSAWSLSYVEPSYTSLATGYAESLTVSGTTDANKDNRDAGEALYIYDAYTADNNSVVHGTYLGNDTTATNNLILTSNATFFRMADAGTYDLRDVDITVASGLGSGVNFFATDTGSSSYSFGTLDVQSRIYLSFTYSDDETGYMSFETLTGSTYVDVTLDHGSYSLDKEDTGDYIVEFEHIVDFTSTISSRTGASWGGKFSGGTQLYINKVTVTESGKTTTITGPYIYSEGLTFEGAGKLAITGTLNYLGDTLSMMNEGTLAISSLVQDDDLTLDYTDAYTTTATITSLTSNGYGLTLDLTGVEIGEDGYNLGLGSGISLADATFLGVDADDNIKLYVNGSSWYAYSIVDVSDLFCGTTGSVSASSMELADVDGVSQSLDAGDSITFTGETVSLALDKTLVLGTITLGTEEADTAMTLSGSSSLIADSIVITDGSSLDMGSTTVSVGEIVANGTTTLTTGTRTFSSATSWSGVGDLTVEYSGGHIYIDGAIDYEGSITFDSSDGKYIYLRTADLSTVNVDKIVVDDGADFVFGGSVGTPGSSETGDASLLDTTVVLTSFDNRFMTSSNTYGYQKVSTLEIIGGAVIKNGQNDCIDADGNSVTSNLAIGTLTSSEGAAAGATVSIETNSDWGGNVTIEMIDDFNGTVTTAYSSSAGINNGTFYLGGVSVDAGMTTVIDCATSSTYSGSVVYTGETLSMLNEGQLYIGCTSDGKHTGYLTLQGDLTLSYAGDASTMQLANVYLDANGYGLTLDLTGVEIDADGYDLGLGSSVSLTDVTLFGVDEEADNIKLYVNEDTSTWYAYAIEDVSELFCATTGAITASTMELVDADGVTQSLDMGDSLTFTGDSVTLTLDETLTLGTLTLGTEDSSTAMTLEGGTLTAEEIYITDGSSLTTSQAIDFDAMVAVGTTSFTTPADSFAGHLSGSGDFTLNITSGDVSFVASADFDGNFIVNTTDDGSEIKMSAADLSAVHVNKIILTGVTEIDFMGTVGTAEQTDTNDPSVLDTTIVLSSADNLMAMYGITGTQITVTGLEIIDGGVLRNQDLITTTFEIGTLSTSETSPTDGSAVLYLESKSSGNIIIGQIKDFNGTVATNSTTMGFASATLFVGDISVGAGTTTIIDCALSSSSASVTYTGETLSMLNAGQLYIGCTSEGAKTGSMTLQGDLTLTYAGDAATLNVANVYLTGESMVSLDLTGLVLADDLEAFDLGLVYDGDVSITNGLTDWELSQDEATSAWSLAYTGDVDPGYSSLATSYVESLTVTETGTETDPVVIDIHDAYQADDGTVVVGNYVGYDSTATSELVFTEKDSYYKIQESGTYDLTNIDITATSSGNVAFYGAAEGEYSYSFGTLDVASGKVFLSFKRDVDVDKGYMSFETVTGSGNIDATFDFGKMESGSVPGYDISKENQGDFIVEFEHIEDFLGTISTRTGTSWGGMYVGGAQIYINDVTVTAADTTTTIAGPYIYSEGLTFEGAGALSITGTFTYSGDTLDMMNEGTLSIASLVFSDSLTLDYGDGSGQLATVAFSGSAGLTLDLSSLTLEEMAVYEETGFDLGVSAYTGDITYSDLTGLSGWSVDEDTWTMTYTDPGEEEDSNFVWGDGVGSLSGDQYAEETIEFVEGTGESGVDISGTVETAGLDISGDYTFSAESTDASMVTDMLVVNSGTTALEVDTTATSTEVKEDGSMSVSNGTTLTTDSMSVDGVFTNSGATTVDGALMATGDSSTITNSAGATLSTGAGSELTELANEGTANLGESTTLATVTNSAGASLSTGAGSTLTTVTNSADATLSTGSGSTLTELANEGTANLGESTTLATVTNSAGASLSTGSGSTLTTVTNSAGATLSTGAGSELTTLDNEGTADLGEGVSIGTLTGSSAITLTGADNSIASYESTAGLNLADNVEVEIGSYNGNDLTVGNGATVSFTDATTLSGELSNAGTIDATGQSLTIEMATSEGGNITADSLTVAANTTLANVTVDTLYLTAVGTKTEVTDAASVRLMSVMTMSEGIISDDDVLVVDSLSSSSGTLTLNIASVIDTVLADVGTVETTTTYTLVNGLSEDGLIDADALTISLDGDSQTAIDKYTSDSFTKVELVYDEVANDLVLSFSAIEEYILDLDTGIKTNASGNTESIFEADGQTLVSYDTLDDVYMVQVGSEDKTISLEGVEPADSDDYVLLSNVSSTVDEDGVIADGILTLAGDSAEGDRFVIENENSNSVLTGLVVDSASVTLGGAGATINDVVLEDASMAVNAGVVLATSSLTTDAQSSFSGAVNLADGGTASLAGDLAGMDLVTSNAAITLGAAGLALGAESSIIGGTISLTVNSDDFDKDSTIVLFDASGLSMEGTTITLTDIGEDGNWESLLNMNLEITLGDDSGIDYDSITIDTLGGDFGENIVFEYDAASGNYIAVKKESSYADMALTENGRAGLNLVMGVVDSAEDGGDLAKVLNALEGYTNDGNYVRADRLGAAVAGATTTSLGSALMSDVSRQLGSIRNRTRSMGVNPIYINEDMPYYNAWISAEGGSSDLESDGTAAGHKLNSVGGSVGVDIDINDMLSLGAAYSYLLGDLTATGADSAEGDMDSMYGSVYARINSKRWSHSIVATFGSIDASLDRTVSTGMDSYKTKGDTDGSAFGLMYEVGYTYAVDEDSMTCIQPVFNVSYVNSSIDGYTETGNTDASLNVGDQDNNYVSFGLGAVLETVVGEDMYNRASVLNARLMLKADAGDRKSEADVSLVNNAGVSQTITGAEVGAVGVEMGLGITIPVTYDVGAIFADVSCELRSGMTEVSGSVGYRFTF